MMDERYGAHHLQLEKGIQMSHINIDDLYMVQSAAGYRDFMHDVMDAMSLAIDWRWSRINHGLITISQRDRVLQTMVSAIAEESIRRSVTR